MTAANPRPLFRRTLDVMSEAFRRLEGRVPPPRPVVVPSGPTLRYVERLPQQALILKLARQTSGLWTADLLLEHGRLQELCVIQRTLDEIGDDIFFLGIAVITGQLSELHRRYLAAFWEEEFDAPTALQSTQKRDMVPRKKISNFILRHTGDNDVSIGFRAANSIHKTYSGFVHAAAPQIMDMCGGSPPFFHIDGMRSTPRMQESVDDCWNHFYRGLMNLVVVARALGDTPLHTALHESLVDFEQAMECAIGR